MSLKLVVKCEFFRKLLVLKMDGFFAVMMRGSVSMERNLFDVTSCLEILDRLVTFGIVITMVLLDAIVLIIIN